MCPFALHASAQVQLQCPAALTIWYSNDMHDNKHKSTAYINQVFSRSRALKVDNALLAHNYDQQ